MDTYESNKQALLVKYISEAPKMLQEYIGQLRAAHEMGCEVCGPYVKATHHQCKPCYQEILRVAASSPALEHLRMSVPEYYADAKKRWPWIECEPHEWDNRSGLENVEYILVESARKLIVYLEFEEDRKAFEKWFEIHGQHMNMASKINMKAGWFARGRFSATPAEGKVGCEECKPGGVVEWLERGYKNCPHCGRVLTAATEKQLG